jgi:hypothetical protein
MVVDEQFRSRPGAREFPCGVDGAAQVEAAVDQHAGDAGQAGCVADHRFAIRVAAGLPVHEVAVADIDQPMIVRLDRRIELDYLESLDR